MMLIMMMMNHDDDDTDRLIVMLMMMAPLLSCCLKVDTLVVRQEFSESGPGFGKLCGADLKILSRIKGAYLDDTGKEQEYIDYPIGTEFLDIGPW
eukprot:3230521-Karenia_brevis.AAC.1